MKNQIVIIGSEPIEEQLSRGYDQNSKIQKAVKFGQISADKLSEGYKTLLGQLRCFDINRNPGVQIVRNLTSFKLNQYHTNILNTI